MNSLPDSPTVSRSVVYAYSGLEKMYTRVAIDNALLFFNSARHDMQNQLFHYSFSTENRSSSIGKDVVLRKQQSERHKRERLLDSDCTCSTHEKSSFLFKGFEKRRNMFGIGQIWRRFYLSLIAEKRFQMI